MVSIYDENVYFVDWNSGKTKCKLLNNNDESSDSDESEGISTFCISPSLSLFLSDDTNESNDYPDDSNIEKYHITVATKKGLVKLYSFHNQQCLRTIKAHNLPILAMAYDPTGTLVATGSTDKTIKVFDILKGHCTHVFRDHQDCIQRLYFHPNIDRLELFSSSDDNTIRCFDLRDSECLAVFSQHLSLPTSMDVSDDGHLLISAGRDKVIMMIYDSHIYFICIV